MISGVLSHLGCIIREVVDLHRFWHRQPYTLTKHLTLDGLSNRLHIHKICMVHWRIS